MGRHRERGKFLSPREIMYMDDIRDETCDAIRFATIEAVSRLHELPETSFSPLSSKSVMQLDTNRQFASGSYLILPQRPVFVTPDIEITGVALWQTVPQNGLKRVILPFSEENNIAVSFTQGERNATVGIRDRESAKGLVWYKELDHDEAYIPYPFKPYTIPKKFPFSNKKVPGKAEIAQRSFTELGLTKFIGLALQKIGQRMYPSVAIDFHPTTNDKISTLLTRWDKMIPQK